MSLTSHFRPPPLNTKYQMMIFIFKLKVWLQNCVSPSWSSGLRAAGRLSLIGKVSEHRAHRRNSISKSICNSPKKITISILYSP